ncbi:aspartyl/asparaginyl beta-hydroxylase domain-containing protein [Pelomonas aquatica]|jgi:beta-hydroxylase|uniref:Aspartyl/asparaginyl beta-hydroxylase domain-containing protein n=1 Tax=Pelomonas aquatica TaxID=431058 RepID=A0A9X4R659_9BURK|nr:aspartyl/asparaginyl beta-hydroxylase domain-containing protein [Pelomonas aquatica]MDG0861073.1 aspartyl/asparaginyl beta-hydroxylase domain-containing protein [Pelomonas aquatica]
MPHDIPYIKLSIVAAFVASTVYVHFRGRVRLGFWRQLTDHSTFMAPINCLMYLFSKLPAKPYLPVAGFPELKLLQDHWQDIRAEAFQLAEAGEIKKSDRYDDAGFNSFFKTGWTRFHLKWYGDAHPSARELCPVTTGLLQRIPSVKAAMFAALPPGGRLVTHRDPFAGSVRYHLGLVTPNDDRCYISVDGERYSWRDGQGVIFDETYLHYAENQSGQMRIILFCDVERPLNNPVARWFNHVISHTLIRAAAAPNADTDKTGGINKAFAYVQQVRLFGKRIKARSRFAYYGLQWLIFGGLFAWWLLA